MTPDEMRKFLVEGHTGILTTLRADGMPISMPVWYAVVDDCVYTRTRGKKLSRIRHDSRASFLVEQGERWAELRAVHLTGTARIIEASRELRTAIEEELTRKYARYRTDDASMPAATRAVYERSMATVQFSPDSRKLNWDNRKLGLA